MAENGDCACRGPAAGGTRAHEDPAFRETVLARPRPGETVLTRQRPGETVRTGGALSAQGFAKLE